MVRKPNKRIVAIIQARLDSTRLFGKVMMDLCGDTVLGRVIDRVSSSRCLDGICVATSTNSKDDIIEAECKKRRIEIYRGSEEDVLDRYCKAAEFMKAEFIVRVTADNPLTEPSFIDNCIDKISSTDFDFVAMQNIPPGSNAEAITKEALFRISHKTTNRDDREHVTSYIYSRPEQFKVCLLEPPLKLRRPDIRITLDTMEDYNLLHAIYLHFRNKPSAKIDLGLVIQLIDSAKI